MVKRYLGKTVLLYPTYVSSMTVCENIYSYLSESHWETLLNHYWNQEPAIVPLFSVNKQTKYYINCVAQTLVLLKHSTWSMSWTLWLLLQSFLLLFCGISWEHHNVWLWVSVYTSISSSLMMSRPVTNLRLKQNIIKNDFIDCFCQ